MITSLVVWMTYIHFQGGSFDIYTLKYGQKYVYVSHACLQPAHAMVALGTVP